MKDVGARGRTEGDSGEKARKWVRGEEDDVVEEKEGESDEGRWREREREIPEGEAKGGIETGIIMEVWNQIISQIRLQS